MSVSLDSVLADLPAELVSNATQERIAAVLAAEKAHQRSIVRPHSPRPAELDSALLARVRFNLETGDPAKDVARLGGACPEVLELEAPFRNRVPASDRVDVDAPAPAAAPAARPRKRTAKKAAGKRAPKKTTAPAPGSGNQAATPASNEGN